MLVRVDFKENIHEEGVKHGIKFSTEEVTDDNDIVRVFSAVSVPDHPNWEKSSDGEPSKLLEVLEDKRGVYWAWGFDSTIKAYFNCKMLSRFPEFSTISGEFYSSKDQTEIWEAEDGSTHLENGKVIPEHDELISSYGVCDTVEQVLERYKSVIDNPNVQIVINVSPITKSSQPSDGGWRWHKWGEYIGTQEPTQEYLYDEEHIDEVLIFHVFAVQKN